MKNVRHLFKGREPLLVVTKAHLERMSTTVPASPRGVNRTMKSSYAAQACTM